MQSIEESHDPQDFLRIGGLSFTLFLINVAVIYIVAVAVFYGKQIRKVRKQMSRYR